jgi:hypothetical protein
MFRDDTDEIYLRGRVRESREMAKNAIDPRAALAHEQMHLGYVARLAALERRSGPV